MTLAPEPILKVSSTITLPDPAVFSVKSAFDGAVNVDPTALRSPKLELEPPLIVIVLVEPVPVAVTPEPTKFKVVAAVDNADPSS